MNLFAVKWYGESEFWLALGKVILILGLIAFTFVTMLGGNPQGDRYGFRYWRNPVIATFNNPGPASHKIDSKLRDLLQKQSKQEISGGFLDFLLA